MGNPKHILPDFLLADLYKHSLVILDRETAGLPAMPEKKQAAPAELPRIDQPITAVGEPAPARPKKEKPLAPPPPRAQWYLGENRKKITLLVSDEAAAYLQDDALNFLSSILAACNLNLGDVAIVNFHRDPLSYQELKEKLNPVYLLLFDVTAKQVLLPFTIPFYQVQKYDSCQFLLAPSLDKMLGPGQDARLEKSKLWLSLKKMFGIQ